MTLKQYLSGYETEDWYNVGFPPGAMMDDVSLAPFLSCGGYTDQLTVRETPFATFRSNDELNANHLPRQAQDKPEEYSKNEKTNKRGVCVFSHRSIRAPWSGCQAVVQSRSSTTMMRTISTASFPARSAWSSGPRVSTVLIWQLIQYTNLYVQSVGATQSTGEPPAIVHTGDHLAQPLGINSSVIWTETISGQRSNRKLAKAQSDQVLCGYCCLLSLNLNLSEHKDAIEDPQMGWVNHDDNPDHEYATYGRYAGE